MNVYDTLRDLEACWHELDSYDRHAYAVTAVKEASAQGADVPAEISRYGGETLSPLFAERMRDRQSFAADEALASAYARLGKVASALPTEEVVRVLFTLDDVAGLIPRYGQRIPDPHLCVYEVQKEANGWSWIHGGLMVNEDQLRRFALIPNRKILEDLFPEELVTQFRADPLPTFESLPEELKILLARMATQSGTRNDGGLRA